jgi:hypothetical protein
MLSGWHYECMAKPTTVDQLAGPGTDRTGESGRPSHN